MNSAVEVGAPFPEETILKGKLVTLIDLSRGKISYAQALGILDLIKSEITAEANQWNVGK